MARSTSDRSNSGLAAAFAGVRMYGPEPVSAAVRTGGRTEFEVTGESSIEAAARMTAERPGTVAVLRFASARNHDRRGGPRHPIRH